MVQRNPKWPKDKAKYKGAYKITKMKLMLTMAGENQKFS